MNQNKLRGETNHCRNRLLRYCKGQGVDLGCGNIKIKPEAIAIDLLSPYADMKIDARLMPCFPDEHFDYVYSSHLLEEIEDTEATLREWLRILKKGGYLILYQADEEYYYKLNDPRCNSAHKHHFSINKLKEILLKTEQIEIVHEARYDPDTYKEWSFEIVAQKKGGTKYNSSNNINFKIMVVAGPAEEYIEKCLNSIIIQDYPNWKAQVILDPVGDKTYERALKFQNDKMSIIQNEKPLYNIANFIKAVSLLEPENNDVLIMIDGDDWLHNSSVLHTVKTYYEENPDLVLTHGSWEPYPTLKQTNNFAYSEDDFKRGIRRVRWRGSHLRTCKYKLWKQLKDESLRDGDYYYTVAGDLAIMFPLLEMAGYHRVKFIPEILYVYNQETPFNDEKKKFQEQKAAESKLRNSEPYKFLENI
ncbi:hypothetical protein DRQ07_07675 [candidate division KSB1 bacterium]|nr:MAG: hypothetical protein DRQ07_07675 [candidate division KSB1 bacterium]